MKWLHPISSLLLLVFSVVILTSSLSLGIGSVQNPGPGFMGFLASILLCILTLIIVIKESMTSAGDKGEDPRVNWETLTKPLVLTLSLCGYVLVLEILGYLVSTFFLMFIMLFISNPRRWYFHLLNAFIIVNITHLVFYKILRVLLPAGTYRILW
jgi:putative tricarboxylic transport membrane protein